MTKFEKIHKFAMLEYVNSTPAELASKIEENFNVGVYIDFTSDYNIAKNGNSTHGLQVWHKYNDTWRKPAGWIIINHAIFKK
jgi:hypothetical protein